MVSDSLVPLDTLVTFSVAVFVLCLSPGPSNMYIMACTLGSGWRAGIACSLGMAVGSLIYVALSAFGFGAMVALYPSVVIVIQILGGIYLLYLGCKAMYLAHKPELKTPVKGKPLKLARQSVLVELSNPKTVLFFVAFLPQFADASQGDLTTQLLLLGALYCFIAFCSDFSVIALSHRIGKWISQSPTMAIRQEQFAGLVLIAVGVFIFTDLIH